ncbi:MAG TPA: hypothetical protein GX497_03370 [Bacillus bacterium]|nr:hypothetical protein [Bacillus sp. (in: firmicutes)]
MSKEGKWLINWNEDGIWNSLDEFETKEDAISYGKANFEEIFEDEIGTEFDSEIENKVFYVGQITCFSPGINAEHVLEQIAEHAYDEVGEVAESYLENVSKEDCNILEERLNNALNEWLKETKNKPNFFKIEKIEEIK